MYVGCQPQSTYIDRQKDGQDQKTKTMKQAVQRNESDKGQFSY